MRKKTQKNWNCTCYSNLWPGVQVPAEPRFFSVSEIEIFRENGLVGLLFVGLCFAGLDTIPNFVAV